MIFIEARALVEAFLTAQLSGRLKIPFTVAVAPQVNALSFDPRSPSRDKPP